MVRIIKAVPISKGLNEIRQKLQESSKNAAKIMSLGQPRDAAAYAAKETRRPCQTWFTKNEMRINTDKTEILVF